MKNKLKEQAELNNFLNDFLAKKEEKIEEYNIVEAVLKNQWVVDCPYQCPMCGQVEPDKVQCSKCTDNYGTPLLYIPCYCDKCKERERLFMAKKKERERSIYDRITEEGLIEEECDKCYILALENIKLAMLEANETSITFDMIGNIIKSVKERDKNKNSFWPSS